MTGRAIMHSASNILHGGVLVVGMHVGKSHVSIYSIKLSPQLQSIGYISYISEPVIEASKCLVARFK